MKLSVPNSKAGQFCMFFLTQMLSYFLFVASTRAVAVGSYFWTTVTDTTFAIQAFTLSRILVEFKEARSFWAGAGYTVGGTVGSLAGIFITKHLYGR